MRRFGVACILVVCAAIAARTSLGYLTSRERAQMARLEQQARLLQDSQSRTAALREQSHATEQQLAALAQLRGRDRVALFLYAIDQAYSENIWLDSVHFMRRRAAGTLDGVPGATHAGIIVLPEGTDPALDVAQGAELLGHAINHTVLAQFMQDLGGQPAVADLRLINTATRTYTTTQVVDFSLSLQVDERAGVRP
jgi:hypothetical protein